MISATHALNIARRWQTVTDIGASASPVMVVDLRGLERSFRRADQDTELARLLVDAPWVNVAIVDDQLDPTFVAMVDAFDVIIGHKTDSNTAIDVEEVDRYVDELVKAITASPVASVALVRLLRTSHSMSVAQALQAESMTYATLQTSEKYRAWLDARQSKTAPDFNPAERAVMTSLNGSLLEITLQRPEKRNALNIAMRDQLVEAFELLDLDPSIDGAVLRGAGDNFSAGGDLDEFGTTPSAAIGHEVRMLRSLPALVHRVRDRVRVHVHGACVGAGIELPAFAATIVAAEGSTFRLPELGFGLIPGAGGTVSVTRRCGRHRTAWLALTGIAINAEQALRWQLIDRIE